MTWIEALDESGRAFDRDNTFNLLLHKGGTVRMDRPWGLTLRKESRVYRTTEYLTHGNALKGARRLYDGLMRQQPTGDDGHEVDPATGRETAPCRCMRCGPVEPRGRTGNSDAENPREVVRRWAPKWSAAGLKARGWTEAMIREYLGEPDTLANNPHYGSAAPMRLYEQERCLEAEQLPEFAERRTKAAERGKTGRKAAEKRAENLVKWADTVEIAWYNAPEDAGTAIRLGMESWEAWNEETAVDADEATRIRWARNYLRHECMSYKQLLNKIPSGPAVDDAYDTIRSRCDHMIDRRYPDL